MNASTPTSNPTPPTMGPKGTAGDSGANALDEELHALLADPMPTTVDEAIDALIAALDLDERDISELQIRAGGGIRIFQTDRSVRSAPSRELRRYKRDRDGFIIREETE